MGVCVYVLQQENDEMAEQLVRVEKSLDSRVAALEEAEGTCPITIEGSGDAPDATFISAEMLAERVMHEADKSFARWNAFENDLHKHPFLSNRCFVGTHYVLDGREWEVIPRPVSELLTQEERLNPSFAAYSE